MARCSINLLTLCTVALLAGCAAPPLAHRPDDLRGHVIAVDGKGIAHDPTVPGGKALSMKEYRDQIEFIFSRLQAFHQKYPKSGVLIFVHGGLNSPADSLASADSEMDRVMAAGYYPIYLDWNSDIFDTYGEHVAAITQGHSDNTVVRGLLSPFYVLADIGRAATRIPVVWANQLGSDIQAAGADIKALPLKKQLSADTTQPSAAFVQQRWAAGSHGQELAIIYAQLLGAQEKADEQHTRDAIHIYIGPDFDVNSWHMFQLGAGYTLTLPTKLLSEPLIDWLGTPAWQVMSRRTLIAFDGGLGGSQLDANLNPAEVSHPEEREMRIVDFSTTGAIEIFRKRLQLARGDSDFNTNASVEKSGAVDYDVTLVGHSMGTMVLNEWLRRDVLESRRKSYSHIVYMAAACSVRDFGRAVVPYLLQNKQTQFYNLMLHPLADLRERGRAWDIPPRGSLLVWLDDFLTDPQTNFDRTLGRWDNVITAIQVIPKSVRGQVTLKAFSLAPYNQAPPPPGQPNFGPQEHGQFRGQPYWCWEFWAEQSPTVNTNCNSIPQ